MIDKTLVIIIGVYFLLFACWLYPLAHCMYYESNNHKRVLWLLSFVFGNVFTAAYYLIKVCPDYYKKGKTNFKGDGK